MDHMNVSEEIDRVFEIEIQTLQKTREGLNANYSKAVDLMFKCQGKVVVTGMGKSGLIAQKIAATMVSTGTPAAFLHSADGMHGDVGILQEGDVTLAISKSGETDELLNILLYVKSLNVPIVSITADQESALAKSSDLVLFTPVEEEACPFDLAPTSSTTAALVVGDALAMGLMKLRGFKPEHFAMRHPGGRLGKQLLLKVSDAMRAGENNPIIRLEDSVAQMLSQLSSKLCGAVSVIDDNEMLLGLITDYDIRKNLETRFDLFSLNISEIMNTNPTYIFSDDLAIEAADTMRNRKNPFLVLPVLNRDDRKVVGMVHFHDLTAKGL